MEKGKASKMITLKSKDGKEFTVPKAVAVQSSTLRNVIEEDWDSYKLYNVDAQTLAMLIDYCKQHVEAADESETDAAGQGTSITPALSRVSEEDLTKWDKQFLDVDMGTLYDLMLAANYLGTEGLLQLTTQRVVDLVKGKTVEEMRQIFKIKNDFTAEEEEKIHCEFPWAFNK